MALSCQYVYWKLICPLFYFSTIIASIVFSIYYVNYCYYVTIILIMCLIQLLWQLFSLFSIMAICSFISLVLIISFDIIRLIDIIDIIYLKSHQHSYVAHCARDRLCYPECIHRHTMQLLQQKYQQSPVIFASPIWPTTPLNRGRVPYLTPSRHATGTLQGHIFRPKLTLQMYSRKIQGTGVHAKYIWR